jgi:hypothetical protein
MPPSSIMLAKFSAFMHLNYYFSSNIEASYWTAFVCEVTVLLKVTPCMLQMNILNINYVILFVSKRHKITYIHNKVYVEELMVCLKGHSQGD